RIRRHDHFHVARRVVRTGLLCGLPNLERAAGRAASDQTCFTEHPPGFVSHVPPRAYFGPITGGRGGAEPSSGASPGDCSGALPGPAPLGARFFLGVGIGSWRTTSWLGIFTSLPVLSNSFGTARPFARATALQLSYRPVYHSV